MMLNDPLVPAEARTRGIEIPDERRLDSRLRGNKWRKQ